MGFKGRNIEIFYLFLDLNFYNWNHQNDIPCNKLFKAPTIIVGNSKKSSNKADQKHPKTFLILKYSNNKILLSKYSTIKCVFLIVSLSLHVILDLHEICEFSLLVFTFN